MAGMESGRLVVDIADSPIKCPVAPIEFCFLADYYFSRRGNRERIDITLVTPYEGAFTKPNANRVLSRIAADKGLKVVGNFSLENVDAEARCINSFEGDRVDYDLLCIVPPNLGPKVVDDSGLGDGTGYVLTDPRTLKSRKADRIYVMGDNAALATSKAGSAAHFEAETIVRNILREIDGKRPLPSYEGHVNCFVESGYHKALLLDFNYDIEPLPGDYPMPLLGPFSLLKESYINHMGKIVFDWVYWNMLLPGFLPKVPFLPSQMTFVGKDLSTHPRVRKVAETRVGEVMRREVFTVSRGTALKDAAELMVEHQVISLPVVDVEGRLIGIVTEGDYLAAMNTVDDDPIGFIVHLKRRRKRCKGTTIDDLMTPDPITVRENDSVRRAVELMHQNHIKRLVITDDDRQVIGILSRADLMRMLSC
jgi:sulfide:quinone oxidoreductase